MKIKGRLYEQMHQAMKAAVDHFGLSEVKKLRDGQSDEWIVWRLWNVANCNLMYDDTHPAFATKCWPRFAACIPGFDIYKAEPGINDQHIESALKKICKQIGLFD